MKKSISVLTTLLLLIIIFLTSCEPEELEKEENQTLKTMSIDQGDSTNPNSGGSDPSNEEH